MLASVNVFLRDLFLAKHENNTMMLFSHTTYPILSQVHLLILNSLCLRGRAKFDSRELDQFISIFQALGSSNCEVS